MSDITPPDATLDALRERERALDIEGLVVAGKLAVIRELIAECTPRTRSVRRARITVPEERAPGGPQPVAVPLQDALDRLGTVVHARQAEMADAA